MERGRILLLGLLPWTMLAVACSDSSSSDGMTPEEYSASMAEAYCSYELGCCPDGTLSHVTREDCLEAVKREMLDDVQGADRLPHTTWSGDNADRCVADMKQAFATTGCAADPPPPDRFESCRTIAIGHQCAGASCAFDAECEPGLRCSAADEAPGTCYAPRSVGEPCGDQKEHEWFECQAGLSCGDDNRCGARVGLGESCRSLACVAGLACVKTSDQIWTCADLRTEGQTCSAFDCAEGLYCTPSYESRPETCTRQGAPGEPCDQDMACLSGHCSAELKCVAPGPACRHDA